MDARQIQVMMKLSFGKGGPEDFAEARRLLGLPAAQGKAKAQLSLGGMHYHEVRRHALSLHAAEVLLPRSRPNRRSLSLCPEIEIWACRQRDRDLGIATRPAASKPAEPLIGVATSPVPVAIGASGWGRGGRGLGGRGLGGRGGQRVQSATAIATGDDAVGAVAHLLGQASLQVPAGSSNAGAAAPVPATAALALDRPPPPPATVMSLADAQFSTGRPEAPESTIGGQSTCIVCFTNPKSHVAVPCGHQCACGNCSALMQECPVCRTPVQTWVHVRVA